MERGGGQELLAEALTTQGRVLARLGDFAESQNTLRRAGLFRGQGQDYSLVPSAFRKENNKLPSLTKRDIRQYKQRRLAERDILLASLRLPTGEA